MENENNNSTLYILSNYYYLHIKLSFWVLQVLLDQIQDNLKKYVLSHGGTSGIWRFDFLNKPYPLHRMKNSHWISFENEDFSTKTSNPLTM